MTLHRGVRSIHKVTTMLKQFNIAHKRNLSRLRTATNPLRVSWSLFLSLVIATPLFLYFAASADAAPASQTTPLPTSLTVNNIVEPPSDPGLFNLLVNGQSVASDVGNNGSSNAILLPFASTYTISVEAGSNTDLDAYATTISCADNNNVVLINESGTSVDVNIASGTQVVCEVRHERKAVFVATLDDAPWMDFDGTTEAGDIIQLTALITKTQGVTATNAVFSLPIDANTQIVSGTASTSVGTIVSGDQASDTTLQVSLGTITDTTVISVSVNVMINTPLPLNVDFVSFQGVIDADNADSYTTDDPSVPAQNDPTLVSVTAKPLLNVSLANRLLIDSDANSEFSSGDRIYYEVTVINIGNGAAQNLEIIGELDPNTTLIPGTITQSAGIIATTETVSGTTELMLNANVLQGGGARLTLQYQAMVNQDIDASSISSQFEVLAEEANDPSTRIRILSDDPSTLVAGDATVAPITAASLNGLYLPLVNSPTAVR